MRGRFEGGLALSEAMPREIGSWGVGDAAFSGNVWWVKRRCDSGRWGVRQAEAEILKRWATIHEEWVLTAADYSRKVSSAATRMCVASRGR